MALYESQRRRLLNPQDTPLRWSLWWKSAIHSGRGLYIEIALSHLLDSAWVVDDITGGKALSFFKSIAGWECGLDSYGTPLSCKRLSPQEEYKAMLSLAPEQRAGLLDAMTCPFTADRKARRMAERAFQKHYTQKFKELAR